MTGLAGLYYLPVVGFRWAMLGIIGRVVAVLQIRVSSAPLG